MPLQRNARAVRPRFGSAVKDARAGASIDIHDSRVGTFNVVNGDHAIFAETLTLIQGGAGAATRPRNLVDLTLSLPENELGDKWFQPAEISARCESLRDARLLMITCADAGISRAAAYAVLGGLGVRPGDARLLRFGDAPSAGEEVASIHQLRKGPKDPPSETVVVVDAVGPRAHTFLDSLLNPEGAFGGPAIECTLARENLLVVCLAEPDRVAVPAGREPPFALWPVPFLEPLLRAAYPETFGELAERIVEQRALGRWSRDDRELAQQIRGRLAQGRLAYDVAAGGLPGARRARAARPNPVHMAALYTGVHFSRLGMPEFDRVVRVLLGDEAKPVYTPGHGSAHAVPALRRWRESAVRILHECGLVVGAEAAGSGVSFADAATRDHLRDRFATEYAVYAHARFQALHAAGLLFDACDEVAGGMIELTAEMAARSPAAYGGEWLAYLYLRQAGRGGSGQGAARRFAQLLRRFSGDPCLKPVLSVVLERLLSAGEHDEVLALVREIRFAPGFDALHWLRQAVDRGDEAAYGSARVLLLDTLRGMGTDPWPLLERLAEWLPEGGDAREHSRSSRLALRLLPEYAVETAVRLDRAGPGAWPTVYPLLAAADVQSLDRHVSLLARWLLHPAMAEAVFGSPAGAVDKLSRLVAGLLAEWAFTLYGPDHTVRPSLPAVAHESAALPEAEGDAAECTPDRVLSALVARIAERLSGTHGLAMARAMLAEWEGKKQPRDVVPGRTRGIRLVRPDLAWKRNLLGMLIGRFRTAVQSPAGGCRCPG